jgi:hypothetical protein
VSVERLQEQLRIESAKVSSAATRAEQLDQLARVMDATIALAAAHGITPAQLEQHRSVRSGASGMLHATGRLLSPTVSHGLSALRAGWVSTQSRATRIRAAERTLRPARWHRVRDSLGVQPGISVHALVARSATLQGAGRWAAAAQAHLAPNGPAWSVDAVTRFLQSTPEIARVAAPSSARPEPVRVGRDSLLAFLSGLADASSERAQMTFNQLDVRARLRGSRRPLVGRTDLRLRVRLERESHGESQRGRALRELLAVTSKAELSAWILSNTSRLVLSYLVQHQLSRFTPIPTFGSVGRAAWTRGWNASPFGSTRLLASRY